MTAVLVILDGASEPLRAGPTSLERAATPALDRLCAAGTVARVRTVAPWLAPGSESAIPALLGWTPPAGVDRGAVEAAAWEVPIDADAGERAWRVDVRDRDGARAEAAAVAGPLAAALPDHRVVALAGHRLLVVGRVEPLLPVAEDAQPHRRGPRLHAVTGTEPHRRLPSRPAVVGMEAWPPEIPDVQLHLWPAGIVPPRLLDDRTVVVAARGAAAGIGRLMGARVVVPTGATGRPGSDLAAKTAAALAALEEGAERVVVHVGGPDEAAHERDAAAKVAAIEAADRDVIAPLAALRERGGTLTVTPDHGCDPVDGRHDAEPVPAVTWCAGDEVTREPAGRRLTERAVAGLAAEAVRGLVPPPARAMTGASR